MYSPQLLTSLYMFRVCGDVSATVRKWYWPFDELQFYTVTGAGGHREMRYWYRTTPEYHSCVLLALALFVPSSKVELEPQVQKHIAPSFVWHFPV